MNPSGGEHSRPGRGGKDVATKGIVDVVWGELAKR